MTIKTFYHILFFTLIDSCINLYIYISTSLFLTYQWFINTDSLTSKYYYDGDSVLYFSIIISTILTAVLYKPLMESKHLKTLWEKVNSIKRKDI